MALTIDEPRTAAPAPSRGVVYTRPSTWPVYWPLLVTVIGYPVFWILGFSSLIPILMAIPFGHQLFRRRPVRLPRGFLLWSLYLTWAVASITMLRIDAPSGVPGGNFSRVLVFGVRLLWIVAATVVMLWAYNLSERELPTQKIVRIVGWMFVVAVAGGLLGVVAPNLNLTSAAQVVLPKGLQSNGFVKGLIVPSVASIETVLGVPGGRPVAPFGFANSWGANLSLFLPFFLVGWCRPSAGWKRWPAMALVGLAIVPVIVSLNRALWICLVLGLVYLIVRTALTGKAMIAIGAVVVVLALGAPLLGSQLGGMVSSRIAHPHSNDRRGGLLEATVSDALHASPILGFGSTRDYRGSFASIAGGGTPECPGCLVPPLGTQGQLWYVIFAQGLVGAAFFVSFFVYQLTRHWRSRTPIEAIGFTLLAFLMIQLFVYDTMDLPMMTVMLGIGLMERRHPASDPATLGSGLRWLRASRRPIIAATLLGALVGGFLGLRVQATYRATVAVELAPIPIHLDLTDVRKPRYTTVDTEAAMVFSEEALDGVEQRTGGSPKPADIQVTAEPNTRVIKIAVEDPDPQRAARRSNALAASYLDVRGKYFLQRRAQLLTDLDHQLDALSGGSVYVGAADASSASKSVLAQTQVLDQLRAVTLSSTSPGQPLRSATVHKVPRRLELWVMSGAAIGLLVGLLVAAVVGPLRPVRRRNG